MAEAWVAAPIIGYLIGSVPIGLWIGRFVANADLRSDGSGKIGTTNAYRALGLRWALLIFGLDVGKGVLPSPSSCSPSTAPPARCWPPSPP